MNEKIILDELNKFSVSVVRKKVVIAEEKEYEVENPHRCAYSNSEEDKVKLKEELPEPYLSAVLAVWNAQ